MPTNYTPGYMHILIYSVNNHSGYVALALANTYATATYYYAYDSPDEPGRIMMLPLSLLQNGYQIFAMSRCSTRPTDLREMQVACDVVNNLPGDRSTWGPWDWCVALLRAMPREMVDIGALAAFALNTGLELQG
ncbi:hypothetical protein DACRYDRAFT_119347 [Dacryopinax primogenitus]|uniref:Uncharacterized protein n=1 Tax=Dacryopinax primogenitus (strain DJM 731) TaxID=1858805 RepID=M5FWD1_DACPD|nr:uncharacterized protein DACRYDRAFT_119347 [Dacryopinax primogenitus]EJT97686.1 hypothetical protein DACRYDRAFT_119347 [Dacryopinax primogenitus]